MSIGPKLHRKTAIPGHWHFIGYPVAWICACLIIGSHPDEPSARCAYRSCFKRLSEPKIVSLKNTAKVPISSHVILCVRRHARRLRMIRNFVSVAAMARRSVESSDCVTHYSVTPTGQKWQANMNISYGRNKILGRDASKTQHFFTGFLLA